MSQSANAPLNPANPASPAATQTLPSGQVVSVPAPVAGQSVFVNSSPAGELKLGFDPGNATYSRAGNNLIFETEEGGRVTVTDFFVVGNQSLPTLTLPDGTKVAAADLLTGVDMTTAAGPGAGAAPGSGGTNYYDDAGDLLAGVDRLGSLGTDFWGGTTEVPEPAQGLLAAADAPGGTGGIDGGDTPVPPLPPLPPVPVLLPPTAQNDFNSINEDGPHTVSGNILLNDSVSTITPATLVGEYGTLYLEADGSYRYELDMTNPVIVELFATNSFDDEWLMRTETFPYTIESPGGTASATLAIEIIPNKFGLGESTGDRLFGGPGNDVLVGDPGGVTVRDSEVQYRDLNVALIVDKSNSVGADGMKSIRSALKGICQQLIEFEAAHPGENVQFTIVGFATGAIQLPAGIPLSRTANICEYNGLRMEYKTSYQTYFDAQGNGIPGPPRVGAGETTSYFTVSTNGKLTQITIGRDGGGDPLPEQPLVIDGNDYTLGQEPVISNALNGWIDNHMLQGGLTNHEAALDAAQDWFRQAIANNPDAVNMTFLISDGISTCSYVDYFLVNGVQCIVPQNYVSDQVLYYSALGEILANAAGAAYMLDKDGVFKSADGSSATSQAFILDEGGAVLYSTTAGTGLSVARGAVDTAEGDALSRQEALEAMNDLQKLVNGLSGEDLLSKAVYIGSLGQGQDFMGNFDSSGTAMNAPTAEDLKGLLPGILETVIKGLVEAEPVGADFISGSRGNDAIFGDALNADFMLSPEWLAAHAGWLPDADLAAGSSMDIIKDYLAQTLHGGQVADITNDEFRHFVSDHTQEFGQSDTIKDMDGNPRGADDILFGDDSPVDFASWTPQQWQDSLRDYLDHIDDPLTESGQALKAAVESTSATDGHDLMFGQGGGDMLFGQGGNDSIYGGLGDDLIHGGAGDDLLYGGLGSDVMYGGTGEDIFAWAEGDYTKGAVDKVMDFTFGEDTLRFDDLLDDGEPILTEDILATLIEEGRMGNAHGLSFSADGEVLTIGHGGQSIEVHSDMSSNQLSILASGDADEAAGILIRMMAISG